MNRTCFSCSAVSAPSERVEQHLRQRADRVERRAEFVAHVREEARLHFVGAAQVVRFLVEFRVQRDDAAVRVLELAVQLRQLFLALAQFGQRAQQFAVLLLHLLEREPPGAPPVELRRARSSFRARSSARPRRKHFFQQHLGAAPRRCALRTGPSAAARRRGRCPCRSSSGSGRRGHRRVRDARPFVGDADQQDLRRDARLRRGIRPRRRRA